MIPTRELPSIQQGFCRCEEQFLPHFDSLTAELPGHPCIDDIGKIDSHVQPRSQQIEPADKESLRNVVADLVASSNRWLTYEVRAWVSVEYSTNKQSLLGPNFIHFPGHLFEIFLFWTFSDRATKISHLIKCALRANRFSLYNFYPKNTNVSLTHVW